MGYSTENSIRRKSKTKKQEEREHKITKRNNNSGRKRKGMNEGINRL